MEVNISARHFDLKNADKEYANEKFSHVSRIHSLTSIDVIFSEEPNKVLCEVHMNTGQGAPIVLSLAAEKVREVIDLTADKCERQLRRTKERKEEKRYDRNLKTDAAGAPQAEN